MLHLSDLKPNPKNPRTISDAKLAMLKSALAEFGDLGCIVYNQATDRIVGGHQRLRVLPPDSKVVIDTQFKKPTKVGTVAEGHVEIDGERFKYREVYWDESKEMAANLAANKGAGEWDMIQLSEWILDLDAANFNLDLTMFDAEERENLVVPVEHVPPEGDPDHVPSAPAEATTKLGDIYELGKHRLMCGDSMMIDQIEALMAGDKADFVFTDPPYNIDYKGGTKVRKKIENDSMDGESFFQFLLTVYTNLFTATKPGASIYVTHADSERVNFTKAFQDAGFHLSSVIIWAKNNATFGRQNYFWKHEPILYGWNSEGAHSWFGPNNEETIWNIDRPSKSEEHPTMKPIELVERCMVNSSKPNDLALDVFGGSGTTLIAAEKTGRVARIMELDPIYCDVIVKRWEKYTSKKAKLVSQGQVQG